MGKSSHTKPVKGQSERAVARRQSIMDAAARLFREKGFQAASTADLAERSGLSVAQIYRDFGSKDDLILAIAARAAELYCSAKEADLAVDSHDPDAARSWIVGLLDRSLDEDNYGLVPELLATATRLPAVADAMEQLDRDISDRLSRILNSINPNASPEAIQDAAFLISTITIGVSTRYRAHCGHERPRLIEQGRLAITQVISRL